MIDIADGNTLGTESRAEKRGKKSAGRQAAVFFLILFLMLCLSSALFYRVAASMTDSAYMKRNTIKTVLLREEPYTIDVLVLGDSESYTTFSPLQVWMGSGISSFVAGQSAQTMSEARTMLDIALEHQKPKVVLMETNMLYRDTVSLKGIQDSFYERAAVLFPVFRYHNLWKALGQKVNNDGEYWKGYEVHKGVKSCGNTDHYMEADSTVKQVSSVNSRILSEIRQKCEDAGAKLILYSGPSTVNYSMDKHNGIAQLAKEQNIPYLDLNLKAKELGMDWNRDSFDGGDHLNDAGSWKVSMYLTRYLKTLHLPDHREDPAYSDWNDNAQSFLKIIRANIMEIQKTKQT